MLRLNISPVNISMVLYSLVSYVMLSTACQSMESIATKPVIEHNVKIDTIPTMSMIADTVTAIATTTPFPSPVSTLTSLPVPTNSATPTLLPTATFMRKVRDIPINTDGFTVSTNGMLLATIDDQGALSIFDTLNWELKGQIEKQNGYTALDFSPDGVLIATGNVNENVYVWNVNTGELVHTLPVPYHTVNSISFSPDGKLLAVSALETFSSNYGIMIWDVDTGELINQFPSGDYGWYVLDTIFVPAHTNLLGIVVANLSTLEEFEVSDKVGGLYFWDINVSQLQEAITGTFGLVVASSPNGQFVAAYIDEDLRVWDIQKRLEILNVKVGEVADTKRIQV